MVHGNTMAVKYTFVLCTEKRHSSPHNQKTTDSNIHFTLAKMHQIRPKPEYTVNREPRLCLVVHSPNLALPKAITIDSLQSCLHMFHLHLLLLVTCKQNCRLESVLDLSTVERCLR